MTVLAGNKNSPETDYVANEKDTKNILSDFFTSTVNALRKNPRLLARAGGLKGFHRKPRTGRRGLSPKGD